MKPSAIDIPSFWHERRSSFTGVELNRGYFSPTRPTRPERAPPCGLPIGNGGASPHGVFVARAHRDPLPARHSLERTLTLESPLDPLLVVILGPTASGKTSLSLSLAERFPAEIVNCDSVAMYREFEIGTAKPSASERARAPHHLLDCVSPTEQVTAGEYARQARRVLEEIKQRGSVPIVVGGTGLYLRAVLDGLFPGPQRSEELRARLRKLASTQKSNYLHRILRRLDREASRKIHPNDTPKLIRAIEVCLASRNKLSELLERNGRDPLLGFRVLRIGLDPDREKLYARIDRRAQQMFEAGLVEETQNLLKKYPHAAVPFASLGYKQAVQFARGEHTLEHAVLAAQQAHRNYAKRQMTWFRREPEVHWLRGFGDEAVIQGGAATQVQALLHPEIPGS